MAEFSKSIPVILEHEGGMVDNPADPGGATNWGISTRFLRSHGLDEDVRTMTRERAIQLYHFFFWRSDWNDLLQDTATKLLDMSVNMGSKTATMLVQRALRNVGELVDVDGVFGNRTMCAVMRAERVAPRNLMRALCAAQADYYRSLAEAKPTMKQFLAGWLKRAAWSGSES